MFRQCSFPALAWGVAIAHFFSKPFFTDDREIVGRSRLESETWGGRLEIDTPLTDDERLNVFWGVDYNEENAEQPFDIFDKEAFEASDGTRFVFEREGLWVPPFEVRNFGAFAQLNWSPSEAVIVRGGLRYANINVSTDDFTTFFDSSSQGGEQTLDDVVFNLGTTVDITDNINLFANFAQGFSAPDFGRILRFPEFNGVTNFSEDIEVTQPQKVDSYELGVRGNWGNVQASVAGFFTYSDLGISLESDEDLGQLIIVRAPKRTYGLEGTLDWQPTDNWQLGSTLTLVDGEEDRDGEGFERLGSRNIQPWKLTGYLQNQTTPDWRNRLQFVLVGDREVDSAIEQEEIESYISFDLISQFNLGTGSLTLGIENLFDNQYFRVNDQEAVQTEGFAIPARGRTFTLNYRVDF
jgi:iron complex outermembrane receptor protein